MSFLNVLCVIVAPAMFWAAYYRYHDRHCPEPYRLAVQSFVPGVGAGFLGVQAYSALDVPGLRRDAFALATTDRWAFAVCAVLVVGVFEETAKLLPFALIVMPFEHFDEPIDGIIYASFIALGFAAYENVHYMFVVRSIEAVLRGFASPLVHAVFALIWVYMRARCFGNAASGRPCCSGSASPH